jgi:hypothetical protein
MEKDSCTSKSLDSLRDERMIQLWCDKTLTMNFKTSAVETDNKPASRGSSPMENIAATNETEGARHAHRAPQRCHLRLEEEAVHVMT